MFKTTVKNRSKVATDGSKRLSLCSPIHLFGIGLFTFIIGNIVLFYFLRAHVSEDASLHFANFKNRICGRQSCYQAAGAAAAVIGAAGGTPCSGLAEAVPRPKAASAAAGDGAEPEGAR